MSINGYLNSGLLKPHPGVLRLPQVDRPGAASPVPVVRHHRPRHRWDVRRVVGPDHPDGVRAQRKVPDPVACVPLPTEPDHGVRVVFVATQEIVVAHSINDRRTVVLSVPVLFKLNGDNLLPKNAYYQLKYTIKKSWY